MLYWLHQLSNYFGPLNLFEYITFRGANAAIMSFLTVIIFGPRVIQWLKTKKIGEVTEKKDSEKLDELHRNKANTPTMGGLIIIIAVVISTLLWCRLTEIKVLMALVTVLCLTAVGMYDDYVKLTKKARGMKGKTKLFYQITLGLVVGSVLFFSSPALKGDVKYYIKVLDQYILALSGPDLVSVPFIKTPMSFLHNTYPILGMAYILWFVIVLTGTSNAVNLTDGLDGLAIGCSIFSALTFAIVAYLTSNIFFAQYLYVPYVPGGGELVVFMMAVIGAGVGFLWFNGFPAEVFMGNTGSLPLGGAIGYVALATRQEFLLLIAGGVFVAEAMSVILQVASFKWTGKRIFRIAPLHHHYQFGGLHEVKISVRFWIVSAILMVFALSILKIR